MSIFLHFPSSVRIFMKSTTNSKGPVSKLWDQARSSKQTPLTRQRPGWRCCSGKLNRSLNKAKPKLQTTIKLLSETTSSGTRLMKNWPRRTCTRTQPKSASTRTWHRAACVRDPPPPGTHQERHVDVLPAKCPGIVVLPARMLVRLTFVVLPGIKY